MDSIAQIVYILFMITLKTYFLSAYIWSNFFKNKVKVLVEYFVSLFRFV